MSGLTPTETDGLPPSMAGVVEDFTAATTRQRLELLLELADELPELPARYADDRNRLEQVHECQTPLFLAVEVDTDPDQTVHLFFDAPAEAPTTRGFAGILHTGLDGLGAGTVLALPDDVPTRLGLAEAVSPLRLRGMSAMLARIKRQVRAHVGAAAG